MHTRKKTQERTTPTMDAGGEGEEKPSLPMAVGVNLGAGMSVGVGSVGMGVSPLPSTPDLLAATTGPATAAVMTSAATTPVLDGPSVGAARVTPRLGGLGSKRMGEALEKGGTSGGAGGTGGSKRRATSTTATITQVTSVPETPLPRPAAALSKLAEYAAASALEQLQERRPTRPVPPESTSQEDGYVFSIRPLMGSPFAVALTKDSSLFDLKDAIFAKAGITPDMQLLAVMSPRQPHQGTLPAVNFEDEEQFLEDLALPRHCTLYLSVRATTGQQVLNDIYVGEDELFVYDILPMVGGNTGNPGHNDASVVASATDSVSSGESSAVETEAESEGADARVTVPMSRLPLPVLQSYLLRPSPGAGANVDDNEHDHGGKDDLDHDRQLSSHVADGLESLRITAQDGDAARDKDTSPSVAPLRPATPFPVFQAPRQSPEPRPATTTAVPTPNAGPARCGQCGVRCRLASQFECRCGRIFCSQHRYYDAHGCTFDHKSHDRARLASANPRVYKPTLDQL